MQSKDKRGKVCVRCIERQEHNTIEMKGGKGGAKAASMREEGKEERGRDGRTQQTDDCGKEGQQQSEARQIVRREIESGREGIRKEISWKERRSKRRS